MYTTLLKPEDIPEYYVMLCLPKTCIKSDFEDLTFYEVKSKLLPKIETVNNQYLLNNKLTDLCFVLKMNEQIIGNAFFFKRQHSESLFEVQFCYNINYGHIIFMQRFMTDCLTTVKNLLNEPIVYTIIKNKDTEAVELIRNLGFAISKDSQIVSINKNQSTAFLW